MAEFGGPSSAGGASVGDVEPFARVQPGGLGRAKRQIEAHAPGAYARLTDDEGAHLAPAPEPESPARLAQLFRTRQVTVELSKALPAVVEMAVIRIQRWYKQQKAMYVTFGPMMFACKDGKISDYGEISYLSGARAAQFIRVSDSTSCAALSHFLEKYWRLRRPDVLISVTGSAATLQLTAGLQRVFDRGLATAAAMTNAWIFTGGTDSGVMKLVGEAMHKHGLDVPLVGVAPWGAVLGRDALEGCKGSRVEYRAPPPGPNGARLNPYHTHQILVDASRSYGADSVAWGHEIEMRSKLERVYAQPHERTPKRLCPLAQHAFGLGSVM
jgi:hypothetical protein